MVDISAALKNLKMWGWLFLSSLLLISWLGCCRKMTPGKLPYACRLNQSVTSTAAEELDVVMFQEQINKALCGWSVVINLGNILVFNLIRKENQKWFVFLWNRQQYSLYFCSRAMLPLPLSVIIWPENMWTIWAIWKISVIHYIGDIILILQEERWPEYWRPQWGMFAQEGGN